MNCPCNKGNMPQSQMKKTTSFGERVGQLFSPLKFVTLLNNSKSAGEDRNNI